MRSLVILSLLLGACTTVPADRPAGTASVASSATAIPKGAKKEFSGYLTILDVPPSAFPSEPPPMPTELDTFARRTSLGTAEERERAWSEANGGEEFGREFQRLREIIEREEATNFVSVRYVRDPDVTGEFSFYRDGPGTLSKYTNDPRFRGVTVDNDPVAFAALKQLWAERAEDRSAAINGYGSNDTEGRIEFYVGIEEAAFQAIAKDRGWDVSDPRLDFRFPEPRPEAFGDRALRDLVRFFPRENEAVAIRLLAGASGRIVLKDGCFRLANDKGRPGEMLVMFARGSQLVLDEEGYLAIKTGDEGRMYRVGEPASWGGPNGYSEDDEDVRALRAACGDDPIINVAAPESERLFATPDALWVLDYAYSKDITYEKAWDRVIGCIERHLERGRSPLDARDRCIDQYNGWDYTGDTLPPPPGQ